MADLHVFIGSSKIYNIQYMASSPSVGCTAGKLSDIALPTTRFTAPGCYDPVHLGDTRLKDRPNV